jgi:hypothetical protein
MVEYVVDSIDRSGHYVGDSREPTKEPETHYFKKPLEERLTLRIRTRTREGWRLFSTSTIAGGTGADKVFLFFRREPRR